MSPRPRANPYQVPEYFQKSAHIFEYSKAILALANLEVPDFVMHSHDKVGTKSAWLCFHNSALPGPYVRGDAAQQLLREKWRFAGKELTKQNESRETRRLRDML